MKVLLIYPENPDGNFWSFKYAMKFLRQKAPAPPLGLITVAKMLPEDWQKKLADLNIEKLKESEIRWADMIFISAMIVQKDSVNKIIEQCKKQNKIIVAGGPLFTMQHEEFPLIDHFILGEAEISLPVFLQDLKENNLKKIYVSKERPDLAKTPIPLWGLVKLKKYVMLPIEWSRGCPYNCEFCNIPELNGEIPRTKEPEQFIGELEALYKIGWRGTVFIVDDNFIGNKVKVKKLLKEIILWQKQKKYPFKFMVQASINLAEDDELLSLMIDGNFYKVFLGIETPNNESLRECNKKQNVNKDIASAVKKIQESGMQTMAGFIVGFDNDKPDTFEKLYKFIQEIGIVTAMVGPLTALPGTKLEKRLREQNRLTGCSTGGNHDFVKINFIPEMGEEVLVKGYVALIKKLYSSNYYKRINNFLRQYKHKVHGRKISWNDVLAFIKSMLYIGVLSKNAIYYWPMVFKLILNPKKINLLPIAIVMAIEGQHFMKVARKIRY